MRRNRRRVSETLIGLGVSTPDRVIDSSVTQRIESDALLAVAGRWTHQRYPFEMAYGTEPAVNTEAFPRPCRRQPGRRNAGGSRATAPSSSV